MQEDHSIQYSNFGQILVIIYVPKCYSFCLHVNHLFCLWLLTSLSRFVSINIYTCQYQHKFLMLPAKSDILKIWTCFTMFCTHFVKFYLLNRTFTGLLLSGNGLCWNLLVNISFCLNSIVCSLYFYLIHQSLQ